MEKETPKILKNFLNYLIIDKNYSIETAKTYSVNLILFFKFIIQYLNLDIKLKDINIFILASIKESDIISYLVYLNYIKNNSPATRNRNLAAIKSFFKYLYIYYPSLKNKLNPAKNIKAAEPIIRMPKYLKLEDAQRLQHIFNETNSKNALRDNAIIILFLNCGLRLSELININIKDINFSERTINIIGKTNKERIIYLNSAVIKSINEYLANKKLNDSDPLFKSNREKRMSKKNVEEICKRAFKLAGLEEYGYTVHSLRHTAATYLYKEVKDILIIKNFLGHNSIQATEIYTHINNDEIKKAVDSNPLNKLQVSTRKRGYEIINKDPIQRYEISLFDCQIELILKSLEVYCYDINEKYNKRKMSKTKAENSEKSLIRDTYHQILAEYQEAKRA